jgi:integration host factor subunit beta
VAKTKSDLINLIAERTKLPRVRAEMIVDRIFDSMTEALKSGAGVEVRGFGTFTVRSYRDYDGRNPRTGELDHVKTKRLPFFKVGRELRQRVLAAGVAAAAGKTDRGASSTTAQSESSHGAQPERSRREETV